MVYAQEILLPWKLFFRRSITSNFTFFKNTKRTTVFDTKKDIKRYCIFATEYIFCALFAIPHCSYFTKSFLTFILIISKTFFTINADVVSTIAHSLTYICLIWCSLSYIRHHIKFLLIRCIQQKTFSSSHRLNNHLIPISRDALTFKISHYFQKIYVKRN